MAEGIKFWPIRGTKEQIMAQPYYDGKIYFAYDTNEIFLDVNGSKHPMGGTGGSGSGIVYANGSDTQITKDSENVDDFNYKISLDALENPLIEPQKDSLILNSDGRFFRVVSIDSSERIIHALLLAVSGSGGGGAIVEPNLSLTVDKNSLKTNQILVQGQSHNFIVTAYSETDSVVTLIYNFVGENGYTKTVTKTATNKIPYVLDLNFLEANPNISLTVTAKADNSNMPNGVSYKISGIQVVEMGVKKVSKNTYIPIVDEETAGTLSLSYIPIGNSALTRNYLHVYVDGNEISDKSRDYQISSSDFNREKNVSIGWQAHGSHTIELGISSIVDEVELYSDTIQFEAAWADPNNDTPIIWIGDYDKTVVNYETASIPFMVYNPIDAKAGRASQVLLFKDGLQISEIFVKYERNNNEWKYWDISAIYELGNNLLAIQQGIASKDIPVYVTNEGSRNLDIQPTDFLQLNFSAAGRSNSELTTQRILWGSTGLAKTNARLSGFNWANNGWNNPTPESEDYSSGAYLTIANGATVEFPVGSWAVNSNRDLSFEFRFRVRNIQKYSTLVTSEAKYFYELYDAETGIWTRQADSKSLSEINQNKEIMRIVVDQYGAPVEDEDHVENTINIENGVICSWLNDLEDKYGFVIGTQEAFFNSSEKLVRVRYKEDQILSLGFVISKTDHTIYIYLNGIPAGAAKLPIDASGNPVGWVTDQNLIFNSEYCDVDLFRVRMFSTGLSTPQVIHNYLSDKHDIKLYDQNQLTIAGADNLLDYNLLVDYNEHNPNDLTMPYATWEITGDDDILPYKKGNNRNCNISFVNPTADKELEDKNITPWEYYTHSPSFYAEGVDINVQGTSSQEYPRRNFKTKYKGASSWIFTAGPLKDQSVAADHYFNPETGEWIGEDLEKQGEEESKDDYKARMKAYKKLAKKFHMDTETVSTNKFTWKIDYMESSGSYNTGMANLMGNLQHPLYNKHPLEDLGMSATDMRTTVYGYPVLTFQKHKDGSYEYIGRYNMNLDKSSNEYYGFEAENEHPYIPGKTIAEVAECWEMKDNQGTWCSLKLPDQSVREIGFDARRGKLEGEGADPIEYSKLEMSRHYEVRYNYKADQIEAILGETLGYNDTVADKFIEEVGSNRTAHNHYLRERFYNLERLLYWLDSTDQSSATNGPIIDYEPVLNEETGDVTIQTTSKNSVEFITADDYTGKDGATSVKVPNGFKTIFTLDTVEYRREKFKSQLQQHLDLHYCLVYFIMTELLLCFDSRGKNMMLSTWGPHEEGGEYIWYPIFYDIDTQLGLNNSGSYLWDYDAEVTEDGIFSTATSVLWNNLWDCYYGDITKEYRIMRGESSDDLNKGNLTYQNIVGAYECKADVFNSLAMKGNRPIIALGLDEYYKYFATTAASGIGYYTTDGVLVREATPTYAYCCQGDKTLSTELLLRNRLNYLDSKWLAGSYAEASLQSSSITARSTLNNLNTSDIYLNLTEEQIANDSTYSGHVHGDYPVDYFDARPGFKIRPFLKQYVTYYTDQIAAQPAKYSDTQKQQEDGGVWTNVNSDMMIAYKEKVGLQDQIFKIPGVDFISSLGDLSTTYLTRFLVQGGKRLLDLHIGSDVPGYKHLSYDPTQVEFHAAASDSQNKPLLKQVILSNIGSLNGGVNFSGSGKLNEFRALGTNLSNAVFAPGAPLAIIHLPRTISAFEIEEASNLTKLISSTPIVGDYDAQNNVFTYRDPSTYEGLYIEGVTDLDINNIPKTSENVPTGHILSRLNIKGGNLGYNSYILLRNLVALKNGATSGNKLGINLEKVHWTPYDLVEYGEPQTTGPYYKLNDHGFYELYTGTDASDWDNLTLNEKIFTKNLEVNESLITSLDLLDIFRADYDNAINLNNFTNLNVSINKTYPYISGDLFINNSAENPIDEAELTNVYNKIWEDLTIRAAYIKESYIAKYVQILDSGKEDELDIIRYSQSSEETVYPTLTSKIPSKQYHDFKGWSLNKNSTVADFATYDPITKTCTIVDHTTSFSAENSTIILYAIFENHPYRVSFCYPNGEEFDYTTATFGKKAVLPSVLPYLDEKDYEVSLTEVYKLKGYSRTPIDPSSINEDNQEYILRENLVNVTNTNITRDTSFYAIFIKQSVYEEPTDYNYFKFSEFRYMDSTFAPPGFSNSIYDVENGVRIDIQDEAKLSGKITLPSYDPAGRPVVAVGPTFARANSYTLGGRTYAKWMPGKDITHIFWHEGNGECKVRIFEDKCFQAWVRNNPTIDGENTSEGALKYVEMPEGLRVIGSDTFFSINSLDGSLLEFPSTLVSILGGAFSSAFDPNSEIATLKIPGSLARLGSGAFQNLNVRSISTLQFGDSNIGSNLTYVINPSLTFINNFENGFIIGSYYLFTHGVGYPNAEKLVFYYTSDDQYTSLKKLIEEVGTSNDKNPWAYFAAMRLENRQFIDSRIKEGE